MMKRIVTRTLNAQLLLGAVLLCGMGLFSMAKANPFGAGWILENDASVLNFQSVKNAAVVEISSFAAFTGKIEPDGTATLRVSLESVDTKVDLRNVRMRFLFFESFTYPEATVSTRIDAKEIDDLRLVRRKQITLPYMLDLHGVTQEGTANLVVTLLTDDLVSVSTKEPITVAAADHNLSDGVTKLEEAAGVTIVPSATVTFDFVFSRAEPAGAPVAAAAPSLTRAALETEGAFDREACLGRFEILSRTGNIYFTTGSAYLDPRSAPLLAQLSDIIARCPGMKIEVSGHTDSDGSASANQRLSEARAASVTEYLLDAGIAPSRLEPRGYGEARPVAPNDSSANKAKNRRIEFAVLQ